MRGKASHIWWRISRVTGSLMSGSLCLAVTPFSIILMTKLFVKVGKPRQRKLALTPTTYSSIVAGASPDRDRYEMNSMN